MAVKKEAKKFAKKIRLPEPKTPPLNGLRRAELIGKQIERWQEQKWTIANHPKEWYKLGLALEALGRTIAIDAMRALNPAALVARKVTVAEERDTAIAAVK